MCLVLTLAFYGLFFWVILGWVVGFGRLPWGHPVRKIYDGIDKAVSPVLRPIRNAIPPVRLGAAALDLSPLILIIGISVLQRIVC